MAVRTRIIILVVLLLLAFSAAVYYSSQRESAAAKQTAEELRHRRYDHEQVQKSSAELAKLGDEAIPTLAAALKGKDTTLDHKYDLWRAKLPAEVQKHLPARPSKDELRRAIGQAIYSIGPNAARPLVGALEFAIEPSGGLENMEVLRALYWSIPESPKAISILSNYLAHPLPGLPLFGMKDAEEIWPTVPHLAPLLGPWLKLTDTAREAAEALSLMGTNAHYAIPLLIELANKGYIGGPENAKLHMGYTEDLSAKMLPHNRAVAIIALGALHHPTTEVLESLRKNYSDPTPIVRACAANALGELGPAAAPLVPHLIAQLDKTHREVLRYQVEALGKIGPSASEAIPVLQPFTNRDTAGAIPSGEPFGRIVRWSFEPLDLPLAAAVSIAQIQPAAAKPLLELISFTFGTIIPSNTVVQLRPLRDDLIPLLESQLKDSSSGPLLPFNTLVLDPQNKAAAEILRAGMAPTNDFERRSVAARWYFHTVGDTNAVLEVFRQIIPSVTTLEQQTPINLLCEIGPAARSLAPLVKPLLSHEDRILRMLAGKTLRNIAPEEMPVINEN
jgi:HEAT repeat protein